MSTNQCDYCGNMEYDEEDETWYCAVSMDEDDYARMMQSESGKPTCPYYVSDDEYKIVRHQM